MIRSAVIVGSGNLAEALARALAAKGMLRQVYARNAARGGRIAALAEVPWTDDPGRIVPADIYLIAVSDSAVAEVAERLPLPASSVVAHTAGSVPLDAIPAAKYPRRASVYPLQTFTSGRAVDLGAVPLLVEGDGAGVAEETEEFAARLTRRVYRADSEQRRLVHLAGVFACNFTNALYGVGERIAARAGFSFDVLRELILLTAQKAVEAGHPADVQTGPAVRGDRQVQQSHLELLAGDERLRDIYRNLSDLIWEISKKTS